MANGRTSPHGHPTPRGHKEGRVNHQTHTPSNRHLDMRLTPSKRSLGTGPTSLHIASSENFTPILQAAEYGVSADQVGPRRQQQNGVRTAIAEHQGPLQQPEHARRHTAIGTDQAQGPTKRQHAEVPKVLLTAPSSVQLCPNKVDAPDTGQYLHPPNPRSMNQGQLQQTDGVDTDQVGTVRTGVHGEDSLQHPQHTRGPDELVTDEMVTDEVLGKAQQTGAPKVAPTVHRCVRQQYQHSQHDANQPMKQQQTGVAPRSTQQHQHPTRMPVTDQPMKHQQQAPRSTQQHQHPTRMPVTDQPMKHQQQAGVAPRSTQQHQHPTRMPVTDQPTKHQQQAGVAPRSTQQHQHPTRMPVTDQPMKHQQQAPRSTQQHQHPTRMPVTDQPMKHQQQAGVAPRSTQQHQHPTRMPVTDQPTKHQQQAGVAPRSTQQHQHPTRMPVTDQPMKHQQQAGVAPRSTQQHQHPTRMPVTDQPMKHQQQAGVAPRSTQQHQHPTRMPDTMITDQQQQQTGVAPRSMQQHQHPTRMPDPMITDQQQQQTRVAPKSLQQHQHPYHQGHAHGGEDTSYNRIEQTRMPVTDQPTKHQQQAGVAPRSMQQHQHSQHSKMPDDAMVTDQMLSYTKQQQNAVSRSMQQHRQPQPTRAPNQVLSPTRQQHTGVSTVVPRSLQQHQYPQHTHQLLSHRKQQQAGVPTVPTVPRSLQQHQQPQHTRIPNQVPRPMKQQQTEVPAVFHKSMQQHQPPQHIPVLGSTVFPRSLQQHQQHQRPQHTRIPATDCVLSPTKQQQAGVPADRIPIATTTDHVLGPTKQQQTGVPMTASIQSQNEIETAVSTGPLKQHVRTEHPPSYSTPFTAVSDESSSHEVTTSDSLLGSDSSTIQSFNSVSGSDHTFANLHLNPHLAVKKPLLLAARHGFSNSDDRSNGLFANLHHNPHLMVNTFAGDSSSSAVPVKGVFTPSSYPRPPYSDNPVFQNPYSDYSSTAASLPISVQQHLPHSISTTFQHTTTGTTSPLNAVFSEHHNPLPHPPPQSECDVSMHQNLTSGAAISTDISTTFPHPPPRSDYIFQSDFPHLPPQSDSPHLPPRSDYVYKHQNPHLSATSSALPSRSNRHVAFANHHNSPLSSMTTTVSVGDHSIPHTLTTSSGKPYTLSGSGDMCISESTILSTSDPSSGTLSKPYSLSMSGDIEFSEPTIPSTSNPSDSTLTKPYTLSTSDNIHVGEAIVPYTLTTTSGTLTKPYTLSSLPSSQSFPTVCAALSSPVSLPTVSTTLFSLRTVSTALHPLSGQPGLETVNEEIPHVLKDCSANADISQIGSGSVAHNNLLTERSQLPPQRAEWDRSRLPQPPHDHALKSPPPPVPEQAEGGGFRSGPREHHCVDSATQTLCQESKGVQTDGDDDTTSKPNTVTEKSGHEMPVPASSFKTTESANLHVDFHLPGDGSSGRRVPVLGAEWEHSTPPWGSSSPGPLEVADLLASDNYLSAPTPVRPTPLRKENGSRNWQELHTIGLSNLSAGEYEGAKRRDVGLALEANSNGGVDLAERFVLTKDVTSKRREYHTASSDPAELFGKSTRSNDIGKGKAYRAASSNHVKPVGSTRYSDIASERGEHRAISGGPSALAKEPDTTQEGGLEDEGLLLSVILNEQGGLGGGSDVLAGEAGVEWEHSDSDEDSIYSESESYYANQ